MISAKGDGNILKKLEGESFISHTADVSFNMRINRKYNWQVSLRIIFVVLLLLLSYVAFVR